MNFALVFCYAFLFVFRSDFFIAVKMNPSVFPCPVCGSSDHQSVRHLKTHLLLKHPNVDLCLFCVEKKGWSDTFASQSQYAQVRVLFWFLCYV